MRLAEHANLPSSHSIRLPYPPSVNRLWRHVGTRVLISAEGRTYRRTVAYHCFMAQLPRPIPGKLWVQVEVCAPDKRKRDMDNVFKCLGDALQDCGVLKNDYDIDRLWLQRGPVSPPEGYVLVTIATL